MKSVLNFGSLRVSRIVNNGILGKVVLRVSKKIHYSKINGVNEKFASTYIYEQQVIELFDVKAVTKYVAIKHKSFHRST